MAPPTQSKPQLPLAPDRAALSNRISMLLANQSTVLKTMKLTRPVAAPSRQPHHHRQTADEDDEEDMRKNSRHNEGVGYIPDSSKTKTDIAKEDQILRTRLLGKRRAGGVGGAKTGARDASDSEEDAGRSALGKRKRPRRVEEAAVEVETEDGPAVSAQNETVEADTPMGDGSPDDHTGEEDTAAGNVNAATEVAEASKSRKKKRKPKKKKKNQPGQGELQGKD